MKTDYYFGLSPDGFHRIAYREWEPAQTKTTTPVICVHGMTRNSRDFDILADTLSQTGRHLYCPDVVGRGESDWLKTSANYTFEQYAADMNALIARTGAHQVDWVGTSMGGIIGMIIASQPHSPIRRLIINDIGPQIPVKAIHRLSKYGGKFPNFTSLAQAIQYFKTAYATFGPLTDDQWLRITQSTVKEVKPNYFTSRVDPGIRYSPNKGTFLWGLLTKPRKTLEGIFFDIDLWDLWKKIKCPVHLIHGQYSDILTPDIIAKMREIRPDLDILEINNVGHAPVLETPEELATIRKWLDE